MRGEILLFIKILLIAIVFMVQFHPMKRGFSKVALMQRTNISVERSKNKLLNLDFAIDLASLFIVYFIVFPMLMDTVNFMIWN